MYKIAIPNDSPIKMKVPGYIFRQPRFEWQPNAFEVNDERFDIELVDESVQEAMLNSFKKGQLANGVYSISGNPDDQKAKYFAAYLAHLHTQSRPNANVVWSVIYGGFSNPLIDAYDPSISLLIISNLSPISTNQRLEKARDLLERYSNIPRLIVSAGVDPFTMVAGKLYMPVNGCIYVQSNAIRGQVI